MEATPQQKNPAKKQRTEEDHPNDVNPEECESPPQSQDSHILSNHVVLNNLFSFLNPQDLERVYYVSKIWNVVAKPLVLLQYDIEIHTNQSGIRPKPITLTNLKSQKKLKVTFARIIKTLKNLPLTRKLDLSLTVSYSIDDRDHRVENLLSNCGHHFKHMNFPLPRSANLNVFFNFLRMFPNLKSMKCSNLELTEEPENPDFDPDQPHYKHENLKKISFGASQCSSSEAIRKFLKIASNLEEIEELPFWLIKAVQMTGKGQALRSLTYHGDDLGSFSKNGVTVKTAFEILARLKPKLSSFSFLPSESPLDADTTIDMIKPLVASVLQSSAESLRSFKIVCTECGGIENMPIFKEVKTLIFQHPVVKGKTFPADIPLSEIFPSVNEIRFMYFIDETWLNGILPEDRNSPWGSQIKRLYLVHLSTPTLLLLGSMFPLIEDLTFCGSAWVVAEHLPVMAILWPQLKSMKIQITNGLQPRKLGPGRFDCAFTGLPPEIVAQLLDPSKTEKFSEAEIQSFKDESTISKFKKLQRLTLTRLEGFPLKDRTKIFQNLTCVANEFGFELLPDLKVSVGIMKDRTWKAIKAALEPLTRNSNVQILDIYPEH